MAYQSCFVCLVCYALDKMFSNNAALLAPPRRRLQEQPAVRHSLHCCSLSPAWRREAGRAVTFSQTSTANFGVWRTVKDVDEPCHSRACEVELKQREYLHAHTPAMKGFIERFFFKFQLLADREHPAVSASRFGATGGREVCRSCQFYLFIYYRCHGKS